MHELKLALSTGTQLVLLTVALLAQDWQHGSIDLSLNGNEAHMDWTQGLTERTDKCTGSSCSYFNGQSSTIDNSEYCDRTSPYQLFTPAAGPCSSSWSLMFVLLVISVCLSLVVLLIVASKRAVWRLIEIELTRRRWGNMMTISVMLLTAATSMLLVVDSAVALDSIRRSCSDVVPDIGSTLADCQAGDAYYLLMAGTVVAFYGATEGYDYRVAYLDRLAAGDA